MFNSCSTLITRDVFLVLRPAATEAQQVRVGRWATLVLVGFGLLWIPMMKLVSGQLYQYLQSVQAYISPPVAAVFLLGIAWRGASSAGAIAALATGFVLGGLRLAAELSKESLSGVARGYAEVNFLHFAVLLFAVCALVLVVVSRLTRAPGDAALEGLTFATTPTEREATPWRRLDGRLTLVLLLLVARPGSPSARSCSRETRGPSRGVGRAGHGIVELCGGVGFVSSVRPLGSKRRLRTRGGRRGRRRGCSAFAGPRPSSAWVPSCCV